ncbi:glycosyltransferase family 39 protein [Singulisphaera sp. PoT]|uniref:glycosyltransferase family 39 protein n=1 Tax=Singulisphaera sp. PoT TaxID=3411797 RepID=UPI003BF61C2E
MATDITSTPDHHIRPARAFTRNQAVFLLAILAGATVLRFVQLGRESLWFDEVVTMRLARADGPKALISLLDQIDATRAPLHPLLLQGWISAFGPSDASGRAFSVVCGVGTVLLAFAIGRKAFDAGTGLWAAWFCAWSPLLVMYSREARMYAWMVFLTSACWWLLFTFSDALRGPKGGIWPRVAYVLGLVALILSHPLGLLMVAALGLASLIDRRAYGLTLKGWLLLHGAAGLLVLGWIPKYLDHPPSYIVGRLPIRFLFGLPIGFVGGDFRVLAACSAVIGFGLWKDHRSRVEGESEGEPGPQAAITRSLLIWFAVSPLLLYGYSWSTHPIFGPARYTLFVGPAYLLLLARGVGRLPWQARIVVAGGLLAVAISLLQSMAYAPGIKADWRSAAAYLKQHDPTAAVVVLNARVDAARYYLGAERTVLPPPEKIDVRPEIGASRVWYAHERQAERPLTALPRFLVESRDRQTTVDFPGLRLIWEQPTPGPR